MFIFTDGSCIGKQHERRAGWSVVSFLSSDDEEPTSQISGFLLDNCTNQRAELTALSEAIKIAKTGDIIYTDSIYAMKCVTEWSKKWIENNWKTSNNKDVLNKDIIEPMISLYDDTIIIKHVKAHTKKNDFFTYGNRIADLLANRMASESINTINNK